MWNSFDIEISDEIFDERNLPTFVKRDADDSCSSTFTRDVSMNCEFDSIAKILYKEKQKEE